MPRSTPGRSLGAYARTKPLEHLSRHYTCIMFDRRECGVSGGRVERVDLERLRRARRRIARSPADREAPTSWVGAWDARRSLAFATTFPSAPSAWCCYWPVGGAKYRLGSHQRFAEHLAFVTSTGWRGRRARQSRAANHFGADPRGGPWASVIRNDPAFAAVFAAQEVDAYKLTWPGMDAVLFDRDTSPGAEPEDLMRLEHPGARHSRPRRRARDLGRALPRGVPAQERLLGRGGGRSNRGADRRPPARIPRRRHSRTRRRRADPAVRPGVRRTMIIDAHCHYTTEPAALHQFRDRQLAGFGRRRAQTGDHRPRHQRRHADQERRAAAQAPGRARQHAHHPVPASRRHGAPRRHRSGQPAVGRRVERSDSPSLHVVAEEFCRRRAAAAVSGRVAQELHRRARACGE